MVQLEGKPRSIPGVPCKASKKSKSFEQRNTNVLFKQKHGKKIDLDLRNVILLDNQSTMDLFCNHDNKVTNSSKKMKLQSNGGTMVVCHKATMSGYKHKVWFSKDAITNIIAMNNLI